MSCVAIASICEYQSGCSGPVLAVIQLCLFAWVSVRTRVWHSGGLLAHAFGTLTCKFLTNKHFCPPTFTHIRRHYCQSTTAHFVPFFLFLPFAIFLTLSNSHGDSWTCPFTSHGSLNEIRRPGGSQCRQHQTNGKTTFDIASQPCFYFSISLSLSVCAPQNNR